MGLFDHVNAPKQKCPKCSARGYTGVFSGWQTKDRGCLMETLDPSEVGRFYTTCSWCNAWGEFRWAGDGHRLYVDNERTEVMLMASDQTLTALVMARLEAGRKEYGDKSRERPPVELVWEMREEVADVVGWLVQLDASLSKRSRAEVGDTELGDELKQRCAQLWRVLDKIEERVG